MKTKIKLNELENLNLPVFIQRGKAINLIGKKFNRLTVERYVGKNKQGANCWYCSCSCGNLYAVGPIPGAGLINGNTQSCGCLNREIISKNKQKI